ncbi:MAG: fumarate lyase [Spirochaetes bacterium]|nr:fumarate lyase [Spirochaetota bacterium]
MSEKKYYQTQTELAVENFGRSKLPRDLIYSLAIVKKACLEAVIESTKDYPQDKGTAILTSLDWIAQGKLDNQFIVPLKQGSAGTSIHMNLCETAASLAEEIYSQQNEGTIKIDPLADINPYQSTNDVFPTAVTLLTYSQLVEIENLVIELQQYLVTQETKYDQVILTGRTELQDALPITLGQVFGSWAGAIQRDRWRLNKLKERIRTISLGGTAIGTCFSAPQNYVFLAEKKLRQHSGLPLCRSQNLPDEISNLDKFSELAGGYQLLSQNLYKISSDLSLYTASFLNEMEHPALQSGSTIMAAKTNPVILEYVRGLSIDVQGECFKIQQYTQNGQLQLNPFLPFITQNFITIHQVLKSMLIAIKEKFFKQLIIHQQNMEKHLANSNAIVNSLLPLLGYHVVKKIYSHIQNKKPVNLAELKKIIRDETDLDLNLLDQYFNPTSLTTYKKGN